MLVMVAFGGHSCSFVLIWQERKNMIYKLIDIELQKLGLLNIEKNATNKLYI